MITTIDFGDTRAKVTDYISGDGDRPRVHIPMIDNMIYRVYSPIGDSVKAAGAEGYVGQDWWSDWETYMDLLSDFKFRHVSVGVISTHASSVCSLNHYVMGVHREHLDWYAGLVDGRQRGLWFRTRHTNRVITAPKVDDHATRLRSILNRMPTCSLYVVSTINHQGEARALGTFAAVYAHSRKGSSVIIQMRLWELDERLLWLMAELYTKVVVKYCDSSSNVVLFGNTLRTNPLKTVVAAIGTFVGFTSVPPGFDSIIRVMEEVGAAVVATSARVRSGDPVAKWLREYPVCPISANNYLLDPGHTEDMGTTAPPEIPEFDSAPSLVDLMRSTHHCT